MGNFLIRKLFLLFLSAAIVMTVAFIVVRLTPGDPTMIALGDQSSQESVQKLRSEWGLDLPLHLQYLHYVRNVLQGNLGRSYKTYRPVLLELVSALPVTIKLVGISMILATLVGILAGVASTLKPGSVIDRLCILLALAGYSFPVFLTGLILMYLFSYKMSLFPVGGTGTWRHLVLPAATLGFSQAGLIARMTRSTMLDVLKEDYIRTARAKGLGLATVVLKHGLRNALIPIITTAGTQFAILLGGSIVIETIFSLPGIGRLMVRSILVRDYMVVQGGILLLGFLVAIVNAAVDVLYGVVDPRIAMK